MEKVTKNGDLLPIFRREKQLEYGVIMIEKDKSETTLNKPIYIGASILN